LFVDVNIRQWAAVRNDSLSTDSRSMEAALAWIPYGRGEALFAATGEGSDPNALTAVLLQARRELFHSYSTISLEFPSGALDGAIQAAGFKSLRTLIWMQATS
jgi:hypothetical protein